MTDPNELKFNPRQSRVIKNIGSEKESALLVPVGVMDQIKEILGYQCSKFEMQAVDYLLLHPDLKPEDLVVECRREGLVGPDCQVLRVRNGEVIAKMTGPKIKIEGGHE